MKKVVFIIPGFFRSSSDPEYKLIAEAFQKKGFHRAHIVPISWKYKRIQDYVSQFKTAYLNHKGDYNLVLCYSFGGVIGYLSAAELQPSELWICSIAPYFKEDLEFIPQQDFIDIGTRRSEDIHKTSFDAEVSKINCPVHIFYGENEQEFVKRRSLLAGKTLKNASVEKVPRAGHDISQKSYINYLLQRIRK